MLVLGTEIFDMRKRLRHAQGLLARGAVRTAAATFFFFASPLGIRPPNPDGPSIKPLFRLGWISVGCGVRFEPVGPRLRAPRLDPEPPRLQPSRLGGGGVRDGSARLGDERGRLRHDGVYQNPGLKPKHV